MLHSAKQIAARGARRLLARPPHYVTAKDVAPARKYIAKYWSHLECFQPEDEGSLIGVPKPYLVPSYAEGHEFDFLELYYWDSYFMIQGFLQDPARKELVMGILEDLISLFKRFKIIPNGSRLYLLSRSQPPFLTSLIFDIYDAYSPGNPWLKEMMKVAEQEYKTVWMNTRKPNARKVYRGLSRYYDFNYLHDLAEAESGWDYTPRFGRHALDVLPVDLNALLYKYETDFARAARIFDDEPRAKEWDRAAHRRKTVMNELLWDASRGLFYDYNYVKGKRQSTSSLAAYFPMWAGMVSEEQANALAKSVKRFEQKGGLATTDRPSLSHFRPGAMPTQWAYPNGWAPLQFITVKALQRYGYNDKACRLADSWLRTNLHWFTVHGEFLEKYNVVTPNKPPLKGVYPSQTGFGWTNAVFERFCQDFIDAHPAPLTK